MIMKIMEFWGKREIPFPTGTFSGELPVGISLGNMRGVDFNTVLVLILVKLMVMKIRVSEFKNGFCGQKLQCYDGDGTNNSSAK